MPIRHSYRIKLTRFYRLLWYFVLFLSACSNSDQNTTTTPSTASTTPTQSVSTPHILKLLFIYDGEKQAWVEEVTSQFNQAHYHTFVCQHNEHSNVYLFFFGW